MNILILSKRQYLGKDLLDDRYWRYYELSRNLFESGHNVTGLCLSYRPRNEGEIIREENAVASLAWHSINLGQLIIPDLIKYLNVIDELIRTSEPDLLYVGSDVYHIIAGSWISRKYSLPYIVDLYDNYESFAASRVPGIIAMFKQAVRSAHGITCVSQSLMNYITSQYKPSGQVMVLENGIPETMFGKLERSESRGRYAIPQEARVVGFAGAISHTRGIDVLLQAFQQMSADDGNVHLLLAGRKDKDVVLPHNQKIQYVGELGYTEVPLFLNALDVGVICNMDSDFGKYCFPQKAYEMIACKLPIVAADIGVMSQLMAGYNSSLYSAVDASDLAEKLKIQLQSPVTVTIEAKTWMQLTDKLSLFMKDVKARSMGE
jgi:glycosyltransferase involved in cell wall biosynthesis